MYPMMTHWGAHSPSDTSMSDCLDVVPMAMEYENLFKDALKFITSKSGSDGDYVNKGGFSPFWTTMTMYKIAERVDNSL